MDARCSPFTQRRRAMKFIYFVNTKPMTEAEQHTMFDECFEYEDYLRANGHVAD